MTSVDSAPFSPRAPQPRRPRRDWGRLLSRVLCALFALIGAVPISGGVLLGSSPAKRWAAAETSRVLHEQLGVTATFQADLSLIPLRLSVTNLQVDSTDGKGPALTTGLAAVSPRLFSLLAGRIDVGDIELEDVSARLVLRDGKLENVRYRLPDRDKSQSPSLTRSPFRSLSLASARVDLTVNDVHVKSDAIDLDAFAEPDFRFDIALQVSGAEGTHERKTATGAEVDEDVLCALELRAVLSPSEIVVRRLSLLAGADKDPAPGTRPRCGMLDPDTEIATRLSEVRVTPVPKGSPRVRGRVFFRAPTPIVNRYVEMAEFRGWVGFSGEVAYSGASKLPEVDGKLSGAGLGLERYTIADELDAHVRVTGDVIELPEVNLRYADGDAEIRGARIEPFTSGVPLRVAKMVTKEAKFPALMHALGTAPHTIIDWNFGRTEVTSVEGTLSPLYFDGRVVATTRDFAVNDRAYHDPAKKRMIGLPFGTVDGRFRVSKDALEFYDTVTSFGSSRVLVDLVSIGFHNDLVIRLKPGSSIRLEDVSPIAGVSVAGTSRLQVELAGPAAHPKLDGTLEVDDFTIGGFEVGDLDESKVHFEPLFVDLIDAKGRKGDMRYHLPSARLAFGKSTTSGASVEFSAEMRSEQFVVRRFFEIFEFDEDPRFDDVAGKGTITASVHYTLGGQDDACKGGHLRVRGNAVLGEAELFGEHFTGGGGRFDFDWFDMKAGVRGLRLDLPHVTLQKGTGTLFGEATVDSGGRIAGDFLATRIPISRIDALSDLTNRASGFVTGSGRIEGKLEALAFDGHVEVSALESGSTRLKPSSLDVRLVPRAVASEDSGKLTACGRAVPREFDPIAHAKDEADADFVLDGNLFAGQVRLERVTISSQRSKHLRGKLAFDKLDFGALASFSGATSGDFLGGELSGRFSAEDVPLGDPLGGRASLSLSEARLGVSGVQLALNGQGAELVIADGHLRSRNLSLVATRANGSGEKPERGVLDATLDLERSGRIAAELKLREMDLGMFGDSLPGVREMRGSLTASATLTGSLAAPEFAGSLEVRDGYVLPSAIATPVEKLKLMVTLDRRGFEVKEGHASWGGGKIDVRGGAPLSSGKLGATNLELSFEEVALPIDSDVRVAFDSALTLTVPPPSGPSGALPALRGSVDLRSARYLRPINVTADVASLTTRGKKTDVELYSPDEDMLEFDVLVRSKSEIVVKNDLVEANLALDPAGVRLTGTNQRYGAVGSVGIVRGGRIDLRGHSFEVQEGVVRFNDPTRLRPEVDVRAVTEYRRYRDQGAATTGTAVSSTSAPGSSSWRIHLHAYGPPDELRVDLSSDPSLSSDDIFLLLTVGLTRTELDQSRQAGVGQSVALEALGSLSGAESAVTKTVPIDEFRFGSTYSSRAGRTEPTVTIGKRLSERIRASVTTSLSDSNEVRSNVEYRATPNLSVEGSYDNAQSSGSGSVANIGGDVRWRLEFE